MNRPESTMDIPGTETAARTGRRSVSWLARLILVVCSLLLSLGMAEIALRVLRPDLATLVNHYQVRDRNRIYTNPTNRIRKRRHLAHRDLIYFLIHNSKALRQHREFAEAKPAGTLRVVAFGDSNGENRRVPVQYSYTEVLDYLLNAAECRAEVLNFAIEGYSTNQSYLRYMDEGRDVSPDIVVYTHCSNDIGESLADGLLTVDETGQVHYAPPPKRSPLHIRIVRQFYLTYFVLKRLSGLGWTREDALGDAWDTGISHDDLPLLERKYSVGVAESEGHPKDGTTARAVRLFTTVLRDWRDQVEADDGQFCVLLLATNGAGHNRVVATLLDRLEIETIDLCPPVQRFGQGIPTNFRPQGDGHWNEEGNKIAAYVLYRRLAESLDLPHDEAFVRNALGRYYRSFSPRLVTDTLLGPARPSADEQKAIHQRYLSLEQKFDLTDTGWEKHRYK